MYDLLIIGAGASGLTAAITAAKRGKSVLLLEKNDVIAKKLLATGNGHCNFTNSFMNPDCYHGNQKFVEKILSDFSCEDAISYFRNLGIYSQDKNGYYYPFSNQAKAVVKAFEEELNRLSVTVLFESEISSVFHSNKGFSVKLLNGKSYSGSNLLFANGVIDAKGKGIDDSAFSYIEQLGHRFHKFLPSLCGFYCNGIDFKRVSGVRSMALLSLYVDDRKVGEDYGEIQFTEYGLSGIPVFQLSAMASRALDQGKKVSFGLDFVTNLSKDELNSELKERAIAGEDILNSILPDKLGHELLYLAKECGGDYVSAVFRMLCDTRVKVIKVRDFKFAQTATGGIDVLELDWDTLESKLVKGLYFAGEIIDVDGICGGYNLHFAWASGHLVGNAI